LSVQTMCRYVFSKPNCKTLQVFLYDSEFCNRNSDLFTPGGSALTQVTY